MNYAGASPRVVHFGDAPRKHMNSYRRFEERILENAPRANGVSLSAFSEREKKLRRFFLRLGMVGLAVGVVGVAGNNEKVVAGAIALLVVALVGEQRIVLSKK